MSGFVYPESADLNSYEALILPALYAVPDETLERIAAFVRKGGLLIGTFKTAFANENIKVFCDTQPHILAECFGIAYDQFNCPENVFLKGRLCPPGVRAEAESFLECIRSTEGEAVLSYDHENWGQYAAVTRNCCGKGRAWYLGCKFDKALLKKVLAEALEEKGIASPMEIMNCLKNGGWQFWNPGNSNDSKRRLSICGPTFFWRIRFLLDTVFSVPV